MKLPRMISEIVYLSNDIIFYYDFKCYEFFLFIIQIIFLNE